MKVPPPTRHSRKIEKDKNQISASFAGAGGARGRDKLFSQLRNLFIYFTPTAVRVPQHKAFLWPLQSIF
jgi:hypothetical protein